MSDTVYPIIVRLCSTWAIRDPKSDPPTERLRGTQYPVFSKLRESGPDSGETIVDLKVRSDWSVLFTSKGPVTEEEDAPSL
jgi:hypothetical protein